jgi:hypothetical protein
MASRGHGWFDVAQLLPGEDLVRTSAARVRMDTPPYWWEGRLVLTSDRLFFLPYVEHPFLDTVAFWLCELMEFVPAGRNVFRVRTSDRDGLFQITTFASAAIIGRAARPWVSQIQGLMRGARPPSVFEPESPYRRAAG